MHHSFSSNAPQRLAPRIEYRMVARSSEVASLLHWMGSMNASTPIIADYLVALAKLRAARKSGTSDRRLVANVERIFNTMKRKVAYV